MKFKWLEGADRNHIAEIIRTSYLGERQSLAWTVGMIASSKFSGEDLVAILDLLDQDSALDETKKQKMFKLRTELKNKSLL